MSVRSVLNRHNDFADSLIERFDSRIRVLALRAAVKTSNEIRERLTLTGTAERALIAPTASNQAILRQADRIFMRHLDELGYAATVRGFTRQFPRQIKFVREIFDDINQTLVDPLPVPNFGPQKEGYFGSLALSAQRTLQAEAARVAGSMIEQTLASVGAVRYETYLETIAAAAGRLQPNVSALAATTFSSFFRNVNQAAFEAVQDGLGEDEELLYVYSGPKDKLNRPFCAEVLHDNRPRTETEINDLDNRSKLKPVFIAAGGFNCRHVWIVATRNGRILTRKKDAPKRKRRRQKEQTPYQRVLQRVEAGEREFSELQATHKRLTKELIDLEIQGLKAGSKYSARMQQLADQIDGTLDKIIKHGNHGRRAVVEGLNLGAPAPVELKYTRKPKLGSGQYDAADYVRNLTARYAESFKDPIKVRTKSARGYASGGREINVSQRDNGRTLAHELGHILEMRNPEILKAAEEFYEKRTAGETARTLRSVTGRNYRKDEWTKVDKWPDPYMGKIYYSFSGRRVVATELISMGIEMLWKDPAKLLREDREFAEWLLNLLARRQR